MQNDLSAVILAAGKSGRIGKPKAFLKFNEKPFIVNILEKLLSFSEKIVIVFGYDAEKMIKLISDEKIYRDNQEKLILEVNEMYEKGMFSSIQCGLRRVKNSSFVLLHHIDQPGLPQKFYPEFISQIDEKFDWIQPSYLSRLGHPIIINQKVINLILTAPIESNLRFLKNGYEFNQKIWECSYPEIHQDIDTIEDYQKLSNGI
ncbi:MAG: NTP transferase domain-containing protein [Ignavibacteria bacterium]